MTRWQLFALSFLTIFVIGCATLRPDTVALDAQQAGYPSAEIIINGKILNGIGIVQIPKGKALNSLNFQVQGYYDGKLRITSTNCQVDVGVVYQNSQKLNVNLGGYASRDCWFQVSETAILPKQKDSKLDVSPLTAWLYMEVVESEETFYGVARKLSGDWRHSITLPVEYTKPVAVDVTGCGVTKRFNLSPVNKRISLPLHQMVLRRTKNVCLMKAVVISPEMQNLIVGVALAMYDPLFKPLKIPVVKVSGKSITFTGEEGVTLVDFNGTSTISNVASFDFDPAKKSIVRLLTVKGRVLIGEYSPSSKSWTWKQ